MIQFNLLPDVKMKYVKAKRTKRLIISLSFLISIISILIVGSLFALVQFGQKKHINDLSNDIKSETAKIQSVEDVDKLLTVQNQLTLLPKLHEDKPEVSRLFDYITFFTPSEAKMLSLSYDSSTKLIIIQGNADKLATVNKMVDNLKAVNFTSDNDSEERPAFSQVATQLSADNDKASFRVQFVYDEAIFDNAQVINMILNGQTYSTSNMGGLQ